MNSSSRVQVNFTGLPEVVRASDVMICEGEKDTDRVAGLKLSRHQSAPSSQVAATTNFEGASFDGVLQPIAVSLPPESQTMPSELLGIHIQLDNASTTGGYTVYVDDWSVYSW